MIVSPARKIYVNLIGCQTIGFKEIVIFLLPFRFGIPQVTLRTIPQVKVGGCLGWTPRRGRDWQVHFEAAGVAFFEILIDGCLNPARFPGCWQCGEKENDSYQPSSVALCLSLNKTPFKLVETKARSWMISILWSFT